MVITVRSGKRRKGDSSEGGCMVVELVNEERVWFFLGLRFGTKGYEEIGGRDKDGGGAFIRCLQW